MTTWAALAAVAAGYLIGRILWGYLENADQAREQAQDELEASVQRHPSTWPRVTHRARPNPVRDVPPKGDDPS